MTTLYRKYRPQVFDEVYGQKHIVETLKRALETDRVAHAYLFCGARGVGKTTVARIMAKAVNCLDEKNKPCGKCANCLSIAAGKFIDLIEIDAASNRGIDEIRDLRDKIQFAPSIGKKRVYIIDEVHMLTREAFNALLKTLEEPPAHTIFIFATTESHKVPLTVMSRCQRFDFLLADEDQVKESINQIVKSEKFKLDNKVVDLIVRASGGSFRDSQSLLDQLSPYLATGEISLEQALQILNLTSFEKVSEFSELLRSGSVSDGFEFIRELMIHGVDFSDFLKMVIIEIRSQLIEKIKENKSVEWETVALQRLIKAQDDLKSSPVESLALELAVADIAAGEAKMTKKEEGIRNKEEKQVDKKPEIRNQNVEKNPNEENDKEEGIKNQEEPKKEEKKFKKVESKSFDKAEPEPEPIQPKPKPPEKAKKDKIELSDDQRRAIVEEVSLKNKNLSSLLSTASWEATDEGLMIFVAFPFYKDKIMETKNYSLLKKVAENILDDTVTIHCEVKKHTENITEEIDEVFGS
jgi:DNA polymerase-3 subunit gamma/tau